VHGSTFDLPGFETNFPIANCLIVGKNPGDVTSEYFYEPPTDPKRDRVRVRRELLDGLHGVGLITEPTLEAFRDAGFSSITESVAPSHRPP
jgi:hypothetical protein